MNSSSPPLPSLPAFAEQVARRLLPDGVWPPKLVTKPRFKDNPHILLPMYASFDFKALVADEPTALRELAAEGMVRVIRTAMAGPRGAHVESMLCLLASCAGYACQAAVRATRRRERESASGIAMSERA